MWKNCVLTALFILSYTNMCFSDTKLELSMKNNTIYKPCGNESEIMSNNEDNPPRNKKDARNQHGEYNQCDCPMNEHFEQCPNRCYEKRCDTIGKKITCSDIFECIPGCICNTNHWRNTNGVCVDVFQCPPLDCSELNATYNACPPHYIDFSCKSLYVPFNYVDEEHPECIPRCICENGYLMNNNGVCIPFDKCDEFCIDPYTTYNPCGEMCEITCLNKDNPPKCDYETCPGPGSCICIEGMARNPYGNCIMLEHCPEIHLIAEMLNCKEAKSRRRDLDV